MLGKIVPFLVWMRVYGPRVGSGPVPKAAELGWAGAERAWVWLHAAGVLLLAAGAACGHEAVLTGGAWTFGLGQLAMAASLGRVARHLGRARPAAKPVS
jgi:hypothetical protein